jgi:hypothetical protein
MRPPAAAKKVYTLIRRREFNVAYCPECLTEYTQGSRECIDCHVPLAAGQPPTGWRAPHAADFDADLDLVAVRSFMGLDASLRAELAKNLLQAHDIPSTLMGEVSSRVMPFHGLVLLRVERNNLAQATEVLDSFLNQPEVLSNEEPELEK